MQFRKVIGVLAGAALLAGGFAAAAPAQADTATYQSWIEEDDPAPFATTGELVFYKGASINFGRSAAADRAPLVSLASVSGLGYTVKESTGYAPSYQLGIKGGDHNVFYARLVWEPYQQKGSPGDKVGSYTNLESGKWWVQNVWIEDGKGGGTKTMPFNPADPNDPFQKVENGQDPGVGLLGSQDSPQRLDYFRWFFGEGTQVTFFGVKQGTKSDITSTVTSLTFGGKNVPLGNPDTTPYSAKDISDAKAPLQTQLDTVKASLAQMTADLTKANADLAKANADLATAKHVNENLQSQLDAAKAALTQSEKDALAKLVAAQNEARTAQAKLVTISGTAKVGKTVTAKFGTSLSAVMAPTYQWYVGGKAVKGATKASLKLVKADARKSLSVKVTTTWTDDLGKAQTVAVTVKYLAAGTIAR